MRSTVEAERKAALQTFIRQCAEDPYADVLQGIVVREGDRLRLRTEPAPATPKSDEAMTHA
jgi:hypothetical protein